MVRPLDRKLLRDVWALKGQALAISLVIGAGVAMFIMYLSTFASLRQTQATYYERYRFAHVFTGADARAARCAIGSRRSPASRGSRPGSSSTSRSTSPELTEPASGRLIGIAIPHAPIAERRVPAARTVSRAGPPGRSAGQRSVRDLPRARPGDRVGAIINGRRRELEIVGIAFARVHLQHPARGADPGRLALRDLLDARRAASRPPSTWKAASTTSPLTLLPGASEADVIARLDAAARAYGGLGAIPRSLQTSHWYLDNELRQLQSVGLILPLVFLLVAAFLLNVVLTRIVSVQREQIAALKALGYTNGELAWHYIKLSLLIGAAGAVSARAGGGWARR